MWRTSCCTCSITPTRWRVCCRVGSLRRSVVVGERLPLLEHLLVIDDGSDTPLPPGGVDYEEALAGESPERDFAPRSAEDLYVLYTGGTTGMPKGVMWGHEDVFRTLGGGINFATGEFVEDEYQLARDGVEAGPSKALVLAPLMHGAAQWGTFGNLFKGVTVVLLEKFDPDLVWAAIEGHDIKGIANHRRRDGDPADRRVRGG